MGVLSHIDACHDATWPFLWNRAAHHHADDGIGGLARSRAGGAFFALIGGIVWTTDAPYRETPEQRRSWAENNVLAVEMQAASLFAFARARAAQVGMVALVSKDVDDATGTQFDTGGHEFRRRSLRSSHGRSGVSAAISGR